MKLFHLSDLHIGKIVNGYEMWEDQRYVFDQILAYVREEQPDAVMIAGDIYDKAVPSAKAVTDLVYCGRDVEAGGRCCCF